MPIIDELKCGKIIIFNSILFKGRMAFCIDLNLNEQIVYRGLFGLKIMDKKAFLSFARVVSVFDYEHELNQKERNSLKMAHLTGVMKKSKTVAEYIEKIFMLAKISNALIYKEDKHV
jgi:hypothetical protein